MRIASLRIRNYRTLEKIDLEFPSSYSAICGANDSGKTNVVRSIRALVKEEDSYGNIRFPGEESDLQVNDDFPKWLDTEPAKREIAFDVTIVLDKVRDAGFYQFVTKQLSVTPKGDTLQVSLSVTYRSEKNLPSVVVTVEGAQYSDLNAQEILKKLQSSQSILFHNSTQSRLMFSPGGNATGQIREISGQHEALITAMKKTVNRGLSKISKSQQSEFEDLLGRLQSKYKVGLSCPSFEFGYFPFKITLGEKKFAVPLDDWGSGTRNRTLILMALFRAKQVGESEASASKVTPVIIIEEPESFLHPSAQAELGGYCRTSRRNSRFK